MTTLGGEVTDAFSRDNSYLCALYQRGPKVEKARQWQQRKGWPGHVVRLRWLYDCARHGVLLPMGPQYDPPPPPPPPPGKKKGKKKKKKKAEGAKDEL